MDHGGSFLKGCWAVYKEFDHGSHELPSTIWITGPCQGWTQVLYRDSTMASIRIPDKVSCPLGLPGMSTLAHIGYHNLNN